MKHTVYVHCILREKTRYNSETYQWEVVGSTTEPVPIDCTSASPREVEAVVECYVTTNDQSYQLREPKIVDIDFDQQAVEALSSRF